MKQVVLIDGNNLMFRSYFATAYTGTILRNSSGFPTNALFGFVSMLNKIIEEEKPSYLAVAFDIGKNFRHEKYKDYKAGRNETPEDLKKQMPIARTVLKAMGIKYFEVENYEADDIIGTLAKEAIDDPEFIATIVSSDKDLLQLITDQVTIKLLKQTGFIRYTPENFMIDYGIEPIKIIDMKALSGDASDNIPGVKGIGEKTALSLLQEYHSLEGIYENIDRIKGKTREKLINDKENAFFSKDIATIFLDVPINVKLEECKFENNYGEELNNIFKELEFNSFLRKTIHTTKKETNYIVVNNINDINISKDFSFYLESSEENYHIGNIIGAAIYDGTKGYIINKDIINDVFLKFFDNEKYTFDLKKNMVLLNNVNIKCSYDLMLSSYLLGKITDDISILMDTPVRLYKDLKKENFENMEYDIIEKAKFIYETRVHYLKELNKDEQLDLFERIEMPLVKVLADMELTGINVDKNILNEMKLILEVKLENLEKKIYECAGLKFNIDSPKQLGTVLFETLNLPGAKKTKSGYSTDASVLQKLIDKHPIIKMILEYRNNKKLYSTYYDGLQKYILNDDKIHTIYKQNLTRTGRLSSTEPNLQNIPVRDEEGRKIRKAFLPSYKEFLCADYSQIELRILASISDSKEMKEVFIADGDIHTKVASDIFGVSEIAVSKSMRKSAKAVIFGIVYGISGFGLGENLEMSAKEAKGFIDKYLELYPDVKNYMDKIVKEAYQNGYVRTLFNRKRVIDELKNSNFMVRQSGERIALNTPIQGTEADIIKKAMIEIYTAMKDRKLKSKMILQVHDELIFDCLEEEKEVLEKLVKEIMEGTFTLSVPLKVGLDYGENWYEAG